MSQLSQTTGIILEMVQMLAKDRENDVSCDFTVIVEERKFRVHRCLLIASCAYFRALFEGEFKEKEQGFVEIGDWSEKTFEYILNIIYGKPADLEGNSVEDILKALGLADMLCFDAFLAECKLFAANWERKGKVGKCYKMAKKLQLGFAKEIRTLVIQRMIKVQTDSSFQLEDEDLQFELFLESLQDADLQETYLLNWDSNANVLRFSAILNWLVSQDENPVNSHLLLKTAELVNLPFSKIEKCLADHFKTCPTQIYQKIVSEVEIALKESRVSFSEKNIGICAFDNKDTCFTLAVYNSKTNKWWEETFLAKFQIQRVFAHQDRLYTIGDAFYDFVDLKEQCYESKPQILPLLENNLICECVFIFETKLYLLCKEILNNKIVIAICDTLSNNFHQVKLNQAYVGNSALTVTQNFVYFLNGRQCCKYEPDDRLTTIIYALPEDQASFERPPLMAANSNVLFIFQNRNIHRISLKNTSDVAFEVMMFDDEEDVIVSVINNEIILTFRDQPHFKNELQTWKLSFENSSVLYYILGYSTFQSFVSKEKVILTLWG